MNKLLLSLAMACLILTGSPSQTMAQALPYYAQGEDVDNIINNDEASVLVQIEDQIFSYSFFQKIQKYFFNIEYIDVQETDNDEHVSDSDNN